MEEFVMMRILSACLCVLAVAASAFAQDAAPPPARVENVTDEYFGQKITDPYRWMEDAKSPEMIAWMKAQSDYARAYLDRLPMRQQLLKRITELSDTGVRVFGIEHAGNMYIYYRRAPGENDRKLYVREGLTGAERVLVDPEKSSAPGKRYSINSYNSSFDGKFVSYIVSVGGSENGEMRVVETATGRDLGELIDRVRFDPGEWLPDGKSFLYNRLQKLLEGAPPTELYQKSCVYLHVLDTNPDDDRAVFGYEVNPNIKIEPALFPLAYVPRGSKYVFAIVNPGVSPNSELYVAPLDALNQAVIPWRKIAAFEDNIYTFDFSSGAYVFRVHGDDLYLMTYKNTPRFKMIRTSLTNPDLSKAETVFPASEAVVTSIGAAKDALYVQTLNGGLSRIHRVDYKTNKAEPLKLPYQGAAYIGDADQLTDGVLFALNSWTKSQAYFAYNPKTETATDTKLMPPIPVDMSKIEVANVKVKPVLLRVDYDAGHGFGSTRKQQNELLADIYAFLFEQLGASETKSAMKK
jgi:prolyl oligopeptidase